MDGWLCKKKYFRSVSICPNLRPHCEAVDKPIESRLIARFVAVSCVECSLMMLSGYCQLQKSTFTPAISSLEFMGRWNCEQFFILHFCLRLPTSVIVQFSRHAKKLSSSALIFAQTLLGAFNRRWIHDKNIKQKFEITLGSSHLCTIFCSLVSITVSFNLQ